MTQAIENNTVGQPTIEIMSLFPRQGEWTEEAYFRLPETNRIIELSEGRLVITPSPTDKHQEIVGNIYFIVGNYLLKHNIGKIQSYKGFCIQS